jgi:imidazolonepropionase-like amidohydrolase
MRATLPALAGLVLLSTVPAVAAAQRNVDPFNDTPFPSTYARQPAGPVVIRNATILTGDGRRIEGGSIVLRDGVIAAIGTNLSTPQGATVIDATGKWVTPGIIDTHSHAGVYPQPGIAMQQDGNELTAPNTAQVWAEHAVWPQDPTFGHALAGGITTLQILPGSGNLFGGRGVTLKNVPSRTYQGMKFPDAPQALKMACGENPKRVYGQRTQFPSSEMANVAGYREGWIEATEYLREWNAWLTDGADPDEMPDRDLQLETLAMVLQGRIRVHNHCYRADEMVTMIDLSKEFGYSIASFHHAVEAYKIRDYLADNGICASMWGGGDWGFKLEAYDGIEENVALVHEAGACAIVHSDDGHQIQRLPHEAAKSMRAAREEGIVIPEEAAIQWVTLNPARSMGIDNRTGSLAQGKMADVVVWSGNPFSVYTKAEQVFIDGAMHFDRSAQNPIVFGDFMLGITGEVGR